MSLYTENVCDNDLENSLILSGLCVSLEYNTEQKLIFSHFIGDPDH